MSADASPVPVAPMTSHAPPNGKLKSTKTVRKKK
jgi:hypothetical protein